MQRKFLMALATLAILHLSCNTNIKIMENQSKESIYPLKEDVETIDGVMKAYYEVVSGPADQARQWVRDNSLHHPNALIVFTGKGNDGKPYAMAMNLNEFHSDTESYKNGFWESEIHRKTEKFGNIAQVWSTYKTIRGNGAISKGINSIQLYNDGNRWWIISWMFDSERKGNKIPKAYE